MSICMLESCNYLAGIQLSMLQGTLTYHFLELQDIDLMPSHIVPSLTQDKEHNDVYSAYNKPGAVMYWLRVSHTGCCCPIGSCPSASNWSKPVTQVEQSSHFQATLQYHNCQHDDTAAKQHSCCTVLPANLNTAYQL